MSKDLISSGGTFENNEPFDCIKRGALLEDKVAEYADELLGLSKVLEILSCDSIDLNNALTFIAFSKNLKRISIDMTSNYDEVYIKAKREISANK